MPVGCVCGVCPSVISRTVSVDVMHHVYLWCVCVCVCVCVCLRARARTCVYVHARTRACMCQVSLVSENVYHV